MTENNNNSLTKEQQDKAVKWINDRWKNHTTCEVCGKKDWKLNAHITSPLTFYNGGFQFGGTAYPTVSVICTNCANTKYFNAVVMGLIEGEKKGEDGGKKE